MSKTILITGATDGIGLLTAQALASDGHRVLLHGRSADKLQAAAAEVGGNPRTYLADLGDLSAVAAMAEAITADHQKIDVVINNAGVFKTSNTQTADGLDVRFVVNTFAPYLLTQMLLPIMPADGRVVNLSSAAQTDVSPAALRGQVSLDHMGAYAQSKLAITLWTEDMARRHPDGPVFVAVNPGSLLASKMVKEGFGVAGNDLQIGVDILTRAALSDEFADASGRYFDNDAGRFGTPAYGRMSQQDISEVITVIEEMSQL